MYYPDLTPYRFFASEIDPKVLNIGWLDAKYSFPQETPSKDLLEALFEKCLQTVNQTRGMHVCQFCPTVLFGVEVSRHAITTILGSAEIRVEGEDGVVYAVPNLIYHYVAIHNYRPPDEFTNALLK